MKIIKQFQLHLRHTQNNFYYEVPAGKMEEVKQRFNTIAKNLCFTKIKQ